MTESHSRAAGIVMTPASIMRRSVAILAGALFVALAAQIAVPLPGNPVPITFQVLAVLLVGGLMGPALGAASLTVYLLLGIAGLPVFAPPGAPGLARLIGPTGGYLLAYPFAAALAGRLVADGRDWGRLAIGLVAATVAIHLGGIAQLTLLTGDLGAAVTLGSVPFLLGDLLKIVIAGLLIRRFAATTRALL